MATHFLTIISGTAKKSVFIGWVISHLRAVLLATSGIQQIEDYQCYQTKSDAFANWNLHLSCISDYSLCLALSQSSEIIFYLSLAAFETDQIPADARWIDTESNGQSESIGIRDVLRGSTCSRLELGDSGMLWSKAFDTLVSLFLFLDFATWMASDGVRWRRY